MTDIEKLTLALEPVLLDLDDRKIGVQNALNTVVRIIETRFASLQPERTTSTQPDQARKPLELLNDEKLSELSERESLTSGYIKDDRVIYKHGAYNGLATARTIYEADRSRLLDENAKMVEERDRAVEREKQAADLLQRIYDSYPEAYHGKSEISSFLQSIKPEEK